MHSKKLTTNTWKRIIPFLYFGRITVEYFSLVFKQFQAPTLQHQSKINGKFLGNIFFNFCFLRYVNNLYPISFPKPHNPCVNINTTVTITDIIDRSSQLSRRRSKTDVGEIVRAQILANDARTRNKISLSPEKIHLSPLPQNAGSFQ